MNLGNRITLKREYLGLTKVELAKRANVSHIQLARYERNEQAPTAPVIRRIADVLGTTTDYLISGEDTGHKVLNDQDMELWIEQIKQFERSDMLAIVQFIGIIQTKRNAEKELDIFLKKRSNNEKQSKSGSAKPIKNKVSV